MTQPPHIAAALAFANDEATPAQLASLGPHPERAALAILAEAQATQPEEATAAALETIARLLQYVVGPKRKHTPCRSYARGIELRTVALLWVIRPDYLAGRSLDATAKGMGISRQLLDRHCVAIGRLVGHANGSMASCKKVTTGGRKTSLFGTRLPAGSAEGHRPFMN